ncbi:hypothetical protein J2Z83_003502 [Virgibacillus natechei]|uniref:Uncharacterized protein n=1 Tax=Virgibacillus natechei TaxID=1216297 RepID=A0ABS4IKH9_9BACI|nr:hypothetical protein [Virgibacillus natechei]MBP1971363.1 hypothetical protein [Virgibacillus natechei]UZD12259.1 hypothetical protein OLD84_15200 [Virgibacillus natechei]
MRKMVFIAMFSSLLLITACSSSDGDFREHIENANDMMNEMEYEDAISILSNVEENVLPGDTYEAGRMDLVEGLKSEAQYMSDHIVELEERYEASMSVFEETQASDSQNVELYSEAINTLDQTIESFNDMTQLDMYQELTAAREEIISEIEDGWLPSLEEGIDGSLESQDFAGAENQLNDMQSLHQTFPDQVTENVLTQYEEKVTEEQEAFVYVPEQAYQWNEIITENDEGSIEIEGIRDTGDSIEVIISFQGYYHTLSDDIALSLDVILSNGDTLTGSGHNPRLLEDKTVKTYSYSHSDDYQIDDIVRFNAELPFVQEDAIQVDFDGVDETEMYEIPGVESIKELHRPEWTIETDEFEVVIDRFNVDDYDIEISGLVKTTEDVVVNDLSTAYLPFTKERSTLGRGIFGSTQESELYEGTDKEFELNYSFDQPITEYHDYIDLHLYNQDVLVDLKNGEIFDKSEPTFIEDLNKNTNTTIGYDGSDQKELINQSGDRAAVDSIILTTSRTSNIYHLSERFDKFTTTAHVHQDHSGLDYGTTELTIYALEGDEEEELYSTTIEEDHEATDIEVDVSDVVEIKIETSQNRGSEGRQQIILEEPMVE